VEVITLQMTIEYIVLAGLISILLYPVVRIGWYMKDLFEVRVGTKRAKATAIEWKTKLRLIPYGFKVTCPHCYKKQWFCRKDLYKGWDNTKKNYRCKHCNVGKAPWLGKSARKAPDRHPLFKPKSAGWRSVYKSPSED